MNEHLSINSYSADTAVSGVPFWDSQESLPLVLQCTLSCLYMNMHVSINSYSAVSAVSVDQLLVARDWAPQGSIEPLPHYPTFTHAYDLGTLLVLSHLTYSPTNYLPT